MDVPELTFVLLDGDLHIASGIIQFQQRGNYYYAENISAHGLNAPRIAISGDEKILLSAYLPGADYPPIHSGFGLSAQLVNGRRITIRLVRLLDDYYGLRIDVESQPELDAP